MNILWVSLDCPYPPYSGGKMAVWNTLQGLSKRGHRVFLYSLVDSEAEKIHIPTLFQICEDVHLYRRNDLIRTAIMWVRHPLQPIRYLKRSVPEMRADIRRFIEKIPVDVFHVEHSVMVPYLATEFRDHLTVKSVTFQSLAYKSLRRVASNLPNLSPNKWVYLWEAERTWHHEMAIFQADSFDIYSFYSRHDLEDVKREYPALSNRLHFLPVGIDIESYERNVGSAIAGIDNQDRILLFIGSMDHPGNEDAVRWFTRFIFPEIQHRVPNARFVVVGRNSKERVGDLANNTITVVGTVADTLPYLRRADVYVAPLRGGAGVRMKVLEALASHNIVVSTRMGIEAASLQNGVHCLVADDPLEFAQKITDVLLQPERYHLLAKNGYELVKNSWSIDKVAEQMEQVYLVAQKRKQMARPLSR